METTSKVDQNGILRCQRARETAIQNVKGDDAKGFHYIKAYCNRPMTLNVSENRKICPECDKQPPTGWVNPRITNAAGIVLGAGELKELGLLEDPSLKAQPVKKIQAVRKPRETKKAVEAKVKQIKDAVTVTVTLEQLEQTEDIAAIFIRGAIEAMDKLPTPTLAESKRLIKLQDRLQVLVEA